MRVSLLPPSFEAAIFDFDGTLAETAGIWEQVDRAFLGTRGIAYTDDYGVELAARGFERGAAYTIERFGLSETIEQVMAEWTSLSNELYRSDVRLKPGAAAYVRALKEQGVPVALATSNARPFLTDMAHVDVMALFDAQVFGNEVEVPKSEPDIYLEAARRLEVDPTRCIVFEDIAVGLSAAAGAGFATCAVRAYTDPGQDWESVRELADVSLTSWETLR